ncbi:MAG TPA: hypothetical protein VHB48_12870 [Chitinophagaceae bacterium]|nr:hypothetical protein [Chitinophagaceae bacterium]
MKKVLLLACLAGNGLLQAQDVLTAKWVAQPVTIDGIAAEWHQPLNFYDDETKLLFAIANDSANLYLCFEAKDNMTETKIMRAGMRIELDVKGRNGRNAGIDFPLPPKERNIEEDAGEPRKTEGDTSGTPGRFGGYRGADPAAFRQRFLTNNITMELKGFATVNGIIPVRGRAISAAMNWDDAGNLYYEVAIPVKELLDDGYTEEDIQKEIALHVTVNGLTGGGGSEGGGKGFGGGGMGRGGMRGGGMHGGGMRGGNGQGGAMGSNRSNLFQKTSFKQKFVLGTNTQQ